VLLEQYRRENQARPHSSLEYRTPAEVRQYRARGSADFNQRTVTQLPWLSPNPWSEEWGCTSSRDAGASFSRRPCQLDLEGIVAKRRTDPYAADTTWYKIKNPLYSQAEGRRELFERRR